MSNNPPPVTAEARFAKKELKAREGEAAMSAYNAEKRATDLKTARLREARLAKEAVDRETARNAPPPPVKVKKKKKAVEAKEEAVAAD